MLLGRGPETARLDELISAAAGGRGGALVVEGEPGVGKTALLEDAAQRASQLSVLRVAGVQCRAGRCLTPPCINSAPG